MSSPSDLDHHLLKSSESSLHVVLLPTAGMGHLTPFLRFAALLLHRHSHRGCRLTLITAHPTVSLAESRLLSRFLSSFPDRVSHLHFPLLPLDPSTVATDDPFWFRFEATRRSAAQILPPLLSSLSPQPSAVVYDISLLTPVVSILESLSLPGYVLFISFARMLSLFAYFPRIQASGFADDALRIPGSVSPIARSSLPALMFDPTSLFVDIFLTDAPKLRRTRGVLINTFDGLEPDSLLQALVNEGKIAHGGPYFPPLYSVGPFPPFEFETEPADSVSDSSPASSAVSNWLDEQPEGSVVYVGFGSRTALPREQLRELGKGLVLSGQRFLWVVKVKKVDKEEEEGTIEEVVGEEVAEGMKGQGLVWKKWVDQGEVLGHKAVGGFLSHCGSNSMVESAWNGVRVLAWPLNGDQRVNAEVVRDSGLGLWAESWGWLGGDGMQLVEAEEIGERVREMMGSEKLRLTSERIGEKARKAGAVGGCRDKVIERLLGEWKGTE